MQDAIIQRMDETPSLLEFPTEFPIKIMGHTIDGFADTVLEIVLSHAPDFDAASMTMKPSKHGKYISLTCTINAVSRAQLDDLYRELSAHPLVILVL